MKYVSVDIETTGLDADSCQILEVGAVIDDGGPLETLPRFQCYIDNGLVVGEPFALAMNHKILNEIAVRKEWLNVPLYKPWEVGEVFAKWLFENGVDPMHVIAAGKNFAGFDAPFLKNLDEFNEHVNFKHRVIDPGSMFLLPGDTEPPNTKTCMERAGIAGKVAHTAVEDAIVVVKLVRFALARKVAA